MYKNKIKNQYQPIPYITWPENVWCSYKFGVSFGTRHPGVYYDSAHKQKPTGKPPEVLVLPNMSSMNCIMYVQVFKSHMRNVVS